MAAQVDHDPSDIAQEGDGNGGTDERQQGFDHTQTDHVVSALRAVAWKERVHELTVLLSLSVRLHLQHVTYDVAERPDGLFAHVLVRRPKQPQEEWHSICTSQRQVCAECIHHLEAVSKLA